MNMNRNTKEILIFTLVVVSILLNVSRTAKADFVFGKA